VAANFAETLRDFPPVQRPNTFTMDDAREKMRRERPELMSATSGGKRRLDNLTQGRCLCG
jgi:hypothetical protein